MQTQQLQGVGPEYVTVNNRVNQEYQRRYKETLVKMQDANIVDQEESSNEIAKLSLRPSVFNMMEQVLHVSEIECIDTSIGYVNVS